MVKNINEDFFNQYVDEIVAIKKHALKPCYLKVDRSKPERRFEAYLETIMDKIEWWWKNGENKQDYFGIKYEYGGQAHTFYPDYLVALKDGRLGIFEVKDSGDRDGKTVTKTKAEALYAWLAKQKRKDLFGSIVIERNRVWFMNDKKTYNWGKCEKGDWSDWRDLELQLNS